MTMEWNERGSNFPSDDKWAASRTLVPQLGSEGAQHQGKVLFELRITLKKRVYYFRKRRQLHSHTTVTVLRAESTKAITLSHYTFPTGPNRAQYHISVLLEST
jgi:hypothetical protein